jgi:hypothetical protein
MNAPQLTPKLSSRSVREDICEWELLSYPVAKSHRRRTDIRSLPLELLARILDLGGADDAMLVVAASHVCRVWRSAVTTRRMTVR